MKIAQERLTAFLRLVSFHFSPFSNFSEAVPLFFDQLGVLSYPSSMRTARIWDSSARRGRFLAFGSPLLKADPPPPLDGSPSLV